MKKNVTRVVCIILAAILCLGLLAGIIPASAAGAVTYRYGSAGNFSNVIYNWGTRGTLATFMSPNAEQFYVDNNITYEELAANVGMTDAAAFAATMEKWNNCVEAGVDEEFGRTSFANKLDTAPYYAIEVGPGVHHTMGGLKINANAEVISTEGAVIAGLYAAGEITGGVHGGNRLGGNAVADIVVFGRIAGASAQSYTSAN